VLRFRYDTSGKWYKGNTHIHSTASDGGKTVAEITELYAGADYDFLCRTDHWAASDFGPREAGGGGPLWLDGVELDAPLQQLRRDRAAAAGRQRAGSDLHGEVQRYSDDRIHR